MKVTLPLLAGTLSLKVKVAVVPETLVVVRVVPLLSRAKLVMSAVFPVPETVRVTAVMFTVEELGSVNTICWTATPEDPASVVALLGALEPWEAETVTAVGVEENV